MTRNHFQVFHCAFSADFSFQHNDTLNPRLPCQFRINRLDLGYQICGDDVAYNSGALSQRLQLKRILQLHPLGASQIFTHFQRHCRVCSFDFAACLNDAIDLGQNSVPVNRITFEEPGELRFLFLKQLCARHDLLAVVLERPLDLCLLIVG